MSSTPVKSVSLPKLWTLHVECLKRNVRYGLGSKAPSLDSKTGAFNRIDCSGYVRWLLYRAGGPTIPDGSWNQRDWCEDHNLKQVPYGAMNTPQNGRLFVGFITPHTNGCGGVGHVWLLAERKGEMVTIESHGGVGVNSRRWNSKTLFNQVHKCFELPVFDTRAALPETPTTEKHDPPILVINGGKEPVESAYLAAGHWHARDGVLAQILGYTTQTPSLPVSLQHAVSFNGFIIEEIHGRLAERGRVDMTIARAK